MIWPLARAGEALMAVVDAAGFEAHAEPIAPAELADEAWLHDAASALGVDAEARITRYPDVPALVASCAPALIRVGDGYLAAIRRHRRDLVVVSPDGTRTRLSIAAVVEALRAPARPRELAAITAAVPLARRARLHTALCETRLRHTPIAGITTIRRAVEAPLRVQARDLGLAPRLAGIAVLHLVGYVLSLLSWWAIGRTILSGRIDPGWLSAWALLVATAVIARTAASRAAGPLAIDAAGALRRRLLAGALRLPPELVRGEGVGRSLGRVFEAQALETLAVSGGFTALFAAIEIVIVAVVLVLGAGGAIQLGLFAITLIVAAAGVRRYLTARRAWTADRLAITHDLVESMTGHATRLAQQPATDRHMREDQALVHYVRRSAQLDRRLVWLAAGIPRGWLVLAGLGLAPALLRGHTEVTGLAIALGGTLLGHGALVKLGDAATRLCDAAIAWSSVAPLLGAGGQAGMVGEPALAHSTPSPDQPLATLRGVVSRAPRGNSVLAGCDLVIHAGDRVLLEGASGAGKSTIAGILGGLRRPDRGLVLASGLDRATLGERGWRRRIAFVPQFHDNHIFFGSLAFNVLLARAWPPSPADLVDAQTLCEELGLGPTLARMPGGLAQLIGETGWQLSHGERSRVFLCRAMLSRAPLVILDESLAALDPETLVGVIGCLERRPGATLVIAHP